MPMVATMKPYTLFVVDDDMPLNPRTDYDNLGKMVCWHSRYNLGDEHDYDEPRDFLQKKLFEMYDVYDRVARLDETIAFLSTEIDERRLPFEMKTQVDVLQRERDNIIGTQITEEEYNFVNEYRGLILRLKRQ